MNLFNESNVRDIKTYADNHRVRLHVIATGAGAGIQNLLWRVPGCSAFLVGAEFPYASEQTEQLLSFRPEKFASEETAIDLAIAAYRRALDDDPATEPVGLGLTASVASVASHRGDHRVHVACITATDARLYTVVLPKGGAERRVEDGDVADTLGVEAIRNALLGYREDYDKSVYFGVQRRSSECAARVRERILARPAFERGRPMTFAEMDPKGHRPLLPGAFNPPHKGHEGMVTYAETFMHVPEAVFTVCVDMPHKPPLTPQDMLARVHGLRHRSLLFTSGDPFYIDKARKYPERPILLGADALERLLDPKWGPDPADVLGELEKLGTKLFVFRRVDKTGTLTAWNVLMNAKLTAFSNRVVFEMNASTWDISSTELRAAAHGLCPAPFVRAPSSTAPKDVEAEAKDLARWLVSPGNAGASPDGTGGPTT